LRRGLFFGGLNGLEEGEGFDRALMAMGENHLRLLTRLTANGARVVVASAPVDPPFADELAAIVDMHLQGMHGGEAASRLSVGEVGPSGKLADGWPLTAADASSAADFGRGPRASYYESIYVGYRFSHTPGATLRHPIGHGFVYATFADRDLDVRQDDGRVTVRARIENTGERDNVEIVHQFVRPLPPASPRRLSLEARLTDARRMPPGAVTLRPVSSRVRKDHMPALAMPDDTERDARVKNAHFVLRMMPFQSLRSLAMSSGGAMPLHVARGIAELAQGHPIRAFRHLSRKSSR
jgi:hypothetical protein